MHAVVTGVAGSIGSHLATELTVRGYRVTRIDREPGLSYQIESYVRADLADTRRCEALFGFSPTTNLHSVSERLVSAAPRPALSA